MADTINITINGKTAKPYNKLPASSKNLSALDGLLAHRGNGYEQLTGQQVADGAGEVLKESKEFVDGVGKTLAESEEFAQTLSKSETLAKGVVDNIKKSPELASGVVESLKADGTLVSQDDFTKEINDIKDSYGKVRDTISGIAYVAGVENGDPFIEANVNGSAEANYALGVENGEMFMQKVK